MAEKIEILPFGSFDISKDLVSALKEEGFERTSEIQSLSIPILLRGKNMIGLAPTGTGKTLSYAVPMIEKMKDTEGVVGIILSPTVALLDQVAQVIRGILSHLDYSTSADVKIIKSTSDFTSSQPRIVLSTPHFYRDIASRYKIKDLKYVVIDEGDMIIFDGFEKNLQSLSGAISKGIVSFFSASLGPQDIRRVRSFFKIADTVDVRETITNKGVEHHFVNSPSMDKDEALISFINQSKPYKAIVFCSKKEDVKAVSYLLSKNGIKNIAVKGDDDKREIKNKIDDFKDGDISILVASDYLSRGIDIKACKEVIHYDLPRRSEYYFHRAGRTGRFDSKGDSYVILTDDEENIKKARELSRRIGTFDNYTLSKNSLRKASKGYVFKNKGKKDQSTNALQKKIRHAVNKEKSNKVKPNYKKKVRKAVERVKEKHRMKVVRTNIARKGGNPRDYH